MRHLFGDVFFGIEFILVVHYWYTKSTLAVY